MDLWLAINRQCWSGWKSEVWRVTGLFEHGMISWHRLNCFGQVMTYCNLQRHDLSVWLGPNPQGRCDTTSPRLLTAIFQVRTLRPRLPTLVFRQALSGCMISDFSLCSCAGWKKFIKSSLEVSANSCCNWSFHIFVNLDAGWMFKRIIWYSFEKVGAHLLELDEPMDTT